ncbi:YchJ family protein [Actinosynnema sp. NPDC059335]|uniref:YchJ family protein n=1 Tax=Actinosynnema sp. NPDC059335 TaxID=3346804 RepID=UPI003671B3A5
MSAPDRCPCGLGEPYEACCGPYHRGLRKAPTAEALMRSRYSAFAVGDEDYLLATWHPTTRPASLELDPEQRWTRLEILDRADGTLFQSTGTVEFRAHYRVGGHHDVLHERSRFVREHGSWLYLSPT